jgi:light-regulated signal transduction histidine kinase (bacteriophytochrome)
MVNNQTQMTADIPLETLIQGCEAEKLHLSGAIQPFGALLRLDAATLCVTHISANLVEWLGPAAHQLLGQPIDSSGWLSRAAFENLPAKPGSSIALARLFNCSAGAVDAVIIRADDAILVELECNKQGAESILFHHFQRPLLTVPADEEGLQRLHDTLLAAFRNITGYDRVMLYRFHEDWSGEVIAEASNPTLGSYLGLHFPASDIPAIARNLYMLNPARLIPDINAAPVPLVGNDAGLPDLTRSGLRSVSPVHLQYLAHMGVGASFSVPIRVANRLWGLVACHHLTARMLAHDQRQACVSLTNAYALSMTSHFASRRLQVIDSLDRRIDRVLEVLASFKDPLDGIEPNAGLLMDVLDAQGFAMAVGDDVVISGAGPDTEGMSLIDGWFLDECKESIASTSRLETLFPGQLHILAVASGMVAVKARSPRSGWVRFYWFRPAEPQEVAWAGNPNKPLVENAGVVMLSPRRSFERWVEIKNGYSRPWNSEEKMTAAKFRNTLLRWL